MKELTAEIIAIGDEMTSGARLDTNTQWLCVQLIELGISVRHASIVGDDLDDNIRVFSVACERVDLVISTGGLGPTQDDLTREALAAVAKLPLVLHEPSLRHIESLFASRSRVMPPRNQVQAMLPLHAKDIFNPRGTAPGIDITINRPTGHQVHDQPSDSESCHAVKGCRVFSLPGVPAEMKEMFSATVAARISEIQGNDRPIIRTAVIKCFGLGESEMESRLGNMISRQSSPRVGITVSAATISLRITAIGDTEDACLQLIDSTRQEIQAKAGQYVFGEGEEFELQQAVTELLHKRRETLATVEVGYAAPLIGWLADVPLSSVYLGGRLILALPPDRELMTQICRETRADWLLVVNGYPTLQADGDVIANVAISLIHAADGKIDTESFRVGGHPSIVHPRVGKTALAFLRSKLLAIPPS